MDIKRTLASSHEKGSRGASTDFVKGSRLSPAEFSGEMPESAARVKRFAGPGSCWKSAKR